MSERHDIGDLQRAGEARIEADRRISMSERLERLHALCLQLGTIKGVAVGR